MAADMTLSVIIGEGHTVKVVRLAQPFIGCPYECRIYRHSDDRYVVASRDVSEAGATDDMQAAAFAIAAVLDPEHNGPWM